MFVYLNSKGLLADGYQVFVVADAICSRTEQNYKTALDLMRDMGAVVTGTEIVCFDLLKEAGTPLFKKISKLIK